MILYGIASALSGDIEDWYAKREEAEAVLAGILRDEPEFEGDLWVAMMDFEQSLNRSEERRAARTLVRERVHEGCVLGH